MFRTSTNGFHHARRAGTCRPNRFRPGVVVLEARTLPTTFTVLNLADSGAGSLRQAILDSENNPGADIIDFDPGVQGTITLTSGQLTITHDLSINGPGAAVLSVSGKDASRVFAIFGGADSGSRIAVAMSGLTIEHGRSLSGAGVLNSGITDLTLTAVVVSNNRAIGSSTSDARGGGVRSTGRGATLTIVDSQIIQNEVDGTVNNRFAYGGGLYAVGARITVTGTTIADNQAVGGAARSAGGGGIDFFQGSATIAASTVTGNEALGGPGFEDGGFGGGIGVQLGGNLTLTGSTVTKNRVVGGDNPSGVGWFGFGGGIDVLQAKATIQDCTIAENEAIGGAGLKGGIGDGGGIRVIQGLATVTDSSIQDNRALGAVGGGNGNGGGILVTVNASLFVQHSTLTGNQAVGSDGGFGQGIGGAIASFYDSFVSVGDSTVTDNRAVGGSHGKVGGKDPVGAGLGGAIAILFGSRLEASHTSISANQAIGGNDNSQNASNIARVGIADGGAISSTLGSEVVLQDCTIQNNQAIGGHGNAGTGPASFVGTGIGGGISSSVDGLFGGDSSNSPSILSVTNCSITDNEALGGNDNTGAGDMVSVGAGLGGAVANYLGATAALDGTPLADNRAQGGVGNQSGGPTPPDLGAGGAVFNGLGNFQLVTGEFLAPSIVTLSASDLTGNEASGGEGVSGGHGGDGWGGAIAGMFQATTTVKDTTITGSLAVGGDGDTGANGGDGHGGGLFNDRSSALALYGCQVTQNTANGGQGGAGGTEGEGVGGGAYNLGHFGLDAFSSVTGNSASTSDDDIFGTFKII
jgi:hypothetical protein